jgi:hypothetical protein
MAENIDIEFDKTVSDLPVLDTAELERLALDIRGEVSLPKPDIDNIIHTINELAGKTDLTPHEIIESTLRAHLPPEAETSAMNIASKLSEFVQNAQLERDQRVNDNTPSSQDRPNSAPFKLYELYSYGYFIKLIDR